MNTEGLPNRHGVVPATCGSILAGLSSPKPMAAHHSKASCLPPNWLAELRAANGRAPTIHPDGTSPERTNPQAVGTTGRADFSVLQPGHWGCNTLSTAILGYGTVVLVKKLSMQILNHPYNPFPKTDAQLGVLLDSALPGQSAAIAISSNCNCK